MTSQRCHRLRCPTFMRIPTVRLLIVAALSAPLLVEPVVAQNASPATPPAPPSYMAGHKTPVPTAFAERRNGPVTLDGRLDEAAWKNAKPISEFTQSDPEEGKPASQQTDVRFLFDDEALYVGAKMFDTGGGKAVMTRLVRRSEERRVGKECRSRGWR